jgi:hypothetical protein
MITFKIERTLLKKMNMLKTMLKRYPITIGIILLSIAYVIAFRRSAMLGLSAQAGEILYDSMSILLFIAFLIVLWQESKG